MSLSHKTSDCTGLWGVRNRGGAQYWLCDVCGAIGYMSVAIDSEAIRENVRGAELARLTEEGRKLREQERER